MRLASRLLAGLLGLAGVVVALVLLLWPLPVVEGTGYCGPAATSDSAVEVRLHPGIVNEGGGGAAEDASQAALLQDLCVGEANDRLREAGIVFGAAVVLAFAAGFAPRLLRRPVGPAV